MKVSAGNPGIVNQAKAAIPKTMEPSLDFKQVLQAKMETAGELLGGKLQLQLRGFEDQILRGTKLSAQELLIYQIRAGQFGLRVELVSKLAETISASWRKLQNG